MSKREELPVSALPLTLRVVLGSPEGGSNDNPVTPALRIIIEGFRSDYGHGARQNHSPPGLRGLMELSASG